MGSVFRQLLHDLCEIDSCEEVPPREISQHINFLFVFLTVRKCGGSDYGLSRSFEHVVFWAHRIGALRKVSLTKAEKAVIVEHTLKSEVMYN